MTATNVAAWASGLLVACAVVPFVYVLAREALRRRATRIALERVERARVVAGAETDVGKLAGTLREQFDALTTERAVEEMLRSSEQETRALGARLFVELGLVERYSKTLREAKRWSDRAHAAEVLGLSGASAAVPALVAAMNDRFEDAASVKAAATNALAKLRDETAIPLLVEELRSPHEGAARSVAEALVAFGPLAVPFLVRMLDESTSEMARVWAARILGRIGDPRATEDLVTRLHDRDDLLRIAAAEALGNIGDARAIQPLIRATLRDPAPQVRAHAAGAVARIEGDRAIDVLVAALADPDYATRLRALEAFEAIRVEDTTPLESALRDPNADVRRRAALALERVGYLDKVINSLLSEDATIRERATNALAELGSVGLLDSVVAYIHHESFQVRSIVARVCGELGVGRIAPLLRSRLGDESWPVRASLVEALGRLKSEGTVPALVPMLTDPEEAVREAVAEALTNFPSRELDDHLEALAAAYGKGSISVRSNMILLIGRISGPRSDELLVRASTDSSDAVRLRAVTALGARGGGDAVVDALVARLTDASLEVRMAAISALGSAATTEAFEGLLSALAGAAPDVRERISEALSRGARAQLFAKLDEIEKTASLDVRLGIAWTLGKCRDAAGVPPLTRFLRDASPILRASAAGALAKIKDRSAREALLTAVDDPNERVRAAVVNALGGSSAEHPNVVAALERRTRDPDEFVRNRALVSLAHALKSTLAPRFDAVAAEATLPARVVAAALVGTESSLSEVLDRLAVPGTLEEVLRFLSHEDPSIRNAFFAAVRLEDPAATADPRVDVAGVVVQYETLLRTSLDVEARRFAVRALSRLHGLRSIDVLANALSSDPAEGVRVEAAEALGARVDDPLARAALAKAAGDPSSEVALRALRALSRRREPEVARALAKRLGAGPPAVQRVVEATLADIHREDPWPFLDMIMGVDVPELLVPAVRVLEAMAHPATLPLLRELSRSTSAPLRAAAVRALAALPTPESVAIVDGLALDPSEDVRLAVLETIVWRGDSLLRAKPLLRDPSQRVRIALASSLDRFEGAIARTAIQMVEHLLDDTSPAVRASALVTMAGSRSADGLRAFDRAFSLASVETRFEMRAEPRAAEVTERLVARLGSTTDAELRRIAVVAISALSAPGFEAALVPSLRDPSPDVRIAVILALTTTDDEEIRQKLAEMLSDPDVSVREAARRSMLRTIA